MASVLEPVAVYWLDAAGSRDHEVVPEPRVTFGVIVEMTDHHIRIAGETGRVDRQHEPFMNSDFTVVPAGMVLAVKRLRKIHEPSVVAEWVRTHPKRKRGRAKS